MPQIMIDYIDMEFVHALNPLYVVPIVAVIVCAFIVYAFGFKSPVQPPSFDGIEEEKKFSKKRRAKDNQKGKTLQNGKVNGNAVNKIQNNVSVGKKKDVSEKSNVHAEKAHVEKPSSNAEKSETKTAKKARQHNDKKDAPEKKKDPVHHDDMNGDGWVQLVSKKGRKNRKKEDASPTLENKVNSVKVQASKKVEVSKPEIDEVNEALKQKIETTEDVSVVDTKANYKLAGKQLKEEIQKEEEISVAPSFVKNKEKVSEVEVKKNDLNSLEKKLPAEKKNIDAKQPVKSVEVSSNLEEAKSKSKKKKKKNTESVLPETSSDTIVSESPAVQEVKETPAEKKKSNDATITSSNQQAVNGKTDAEQLADMKSSNVVFDELAGLFPEEKEQRRKKKVRRDH